MAAWDEDLAKAHEKLLVADHVLTMTYPLVRDARILMVVAENLHIGLSNALTALLHYERSRRRILPFHDSYESKMRVLSTQLAAKHGISREQLTLVAEIHDIVEKHHASRVEFTRKDSFVIASDGYRLTTISVPVLKAYLARSRQFVNSMEGIIRKNETGY